MAEGASSSSSRRAMESIHIRWPRQRHRRQMHRRLWASAPPMVTRWRQYRPCTAVALFSRLPMCLITFRVWPPITMPRIRTPFTSTPMRCYHSVYVDRGKTVNINVFQPSVIPSVGVDIREMRASYLHPSRPNEQPRCRRVLLAQLRRRHPEIQRTG